MIFSPQYTYKNQNSKGTVQCIYQNGHVTHNLVSLCHDALIAAVSFATLSCRFNYVCSCHACKNSRMPLHRSSSCLLWGPKVLIFDYSHCSCFKPGSYFTLTRIQNLHEGALKEQYDHFGSILALQLWSVLHNNYCIFKLNLSTGVSLFNSYIIVLLPCFISVQTRKRFLRFHDWL